MLDGFWAKRECEHWQLGHAAQSAVLHLFNPLPLEVGTKLLPGNVALELNYFQRVGEPEFACKTLNSRPPTCAVQDF